jgi:uncharacterized membrane protein YfcA
LHIHFHQAAFLFGAALVGGILNSVAGGGGFLVFPALIVTGMPPIQANATNTFALWPGTVASTGAYRNALSRQDRRMVLPLVVTGVAGGFIGAVVLLKTPPATFMRLVPWLLLSATLLFVFSRRISRWIRARTAHLQSSTKLNVVGAALVQLLIAIYIGYFGAGAGIMMLALFALMGLESIHTMNGLKTMLASICNGMALIAFIAAHAIVWPQALLMTVGAAIGGYGGAYFAQKLPPEHVRYFVIVTGFSMSLYFFVR